VIEGYRLALRESQRFLHEHLQIREVNLTRVAML
jgi:hypothetical protein